MAITGTAAVGLLVARLLFGGVLAFMGANHFLQTDAMAGYAAAKELPAPRLAVLGSGLLLVVAGLAIVAGAFPAVASVAVAGFLLVTAVAMHDFWAVPDEQAQDELTQFLKNVVMAGGALAFAAVATEPWAYSLSVGLL